MLRNKNKIVSQILWLHLGLVLFLQLKGRVYKFAVSTKTVISKCDIDIFIFIIAQTLGRVQFDFRVEGVLYALEKSFSKS